MKDQYNYLLKIQEVSFKDILVTKNVLKNNLFVPSYRVALADSEQVIDHRTISSNEIVFDLDFKNYMLVYKHAKLITTTLDERKIPYYIFSTGGKGLHIHIFFNKLEITNDEIKKLFHEAIQYNFTWTHLRQFIFNLVCEESGINREYVGKYIDTQKVNFNDLEDSTVLIRACGGRNQRMDTVTGITTTTYKTWLPEELKERKVVVSNIAHVKYPTEIKMFDINQHELGQCLKDYIKHAKETNIQALENVKLPNGYTGLASVQKIIEGLEAGKRNEGAKVLALALVLDGISDERAERVMIEYANNCSQIGHPFTKSEAITWYKWMKHQPDHFWNNEYVKKLGVWDKDTDDYYKMFKKDSAKVLGNKTLLKRIDTYLSKEIVGEKETRILIFLLLLSSKFKISKDWNVIGDPKPQSIILSSLSASGKSYITKTILKLFGDDGIDYYAFSRMTGAVLNYFTDIDMTNKTLFVEELQGLDKDSNQLRLWISEGKLKLATVEKVEEGEETKNRLVIKESIGQPVFITGTAEDTVDEQMNNRSWLVSLDISEAQNKAILQYESDIASRQPESNFDELRLLRDAIKELKPYHFIIPYFNFEMLNIPTNDVRIRRDYKKFGDLICCIALLFQKQRIIVKDEKGNEFIVSSLEDYEIAVKYSEKVLASTFSGLTAQQIWVLDQIKCEAWNNEFESADVQRLTNWSQSKCYTVLKQLEEVGALTATSRKPGSPSVFSLNHKKKLVNLLLPTKEELLEKLKKNPTNFDLLQKYDFYYEAMTNNKEIFEKIIGCIQNQIKKEENPIGGGNSCVIDTLVAHGDQHLYINPISKNTVISTVVENSSEKNLLTEEMTHLKTANSPVITVEKTEEIGRNRLISDEKTPVSRQQNSSEKTVKATKQNIIEFIDKSTEHMIRELDLVNQFGTETDNILDNLCKEGTLFRPKAGYIMKL